MNVICQYCNTNAKLVDSSVVYGKSYGMIWYCQDCKAWVGVHKNSKKNAPLGILANSELREWKKKAHSLFDELWKIKMEKDKCSKSKARKAAYKWLSGMMGIDYNKCHIGKFDIEKCKQVVNICQNFHLWVRRYKKTLDKEM